MIPSAYQKFGKICDIFLSPVPGTFILLTKTQQFGHKSILSISDSSVPTDLKRFFVYGIEHDFSSGFCAPYIAPLSRSLRRLT
jgi:hypothetical protein